MALSKLTDIRKSLSVEAENLKVNGITTFTGNVSIGGTLTYEDVTNIDSVGIVTAREGIFIPDNKKLEIGNASGSGDLQLYHNESDSYITDTGTGDLKIGGATRVDIGNADLSKLYFRGTNGGGANLYHNNSLKIGTYNSGLNVYGDVTLNDSIIHRDDLNTKIRFPADDTITAETAGSERLRIDSSGNVGINSAAPNTRLDVIRSYVNRTWTPGSSIVSMFERNGNSRVAIVGSSAGACEINFGDTDDDNVGYIKYDHSDNSMSFRTNATERIRIASDGSIGVGNTSPTSWGGGIPTIEFKGTSGSYTSRSGAIAFESQSGSNGYNVIYCDAGNMSLYSGATNRASAAEILRIDSNGTVVLKNTAAATPRSDFLGSLRPISQIASTWNAYHSLTRHDAGSSYGPYLMLAKNRNDAYNSNGIVQDNDELGNISFQGNDGSVFREGVRIRGEVEGTPASNQMPSALTFWTNSGSGMAERVRISSEGYVTKPEHPSFYVRRSIGGNGRAAAVPITEWSSTYANGAHNNGSHFNTSTGLFTAPVNGFYHFSACGGYKQTNLSFNQKFRLNNTNITEGCRLISGLTDHSTATISATIYMAAGDTLGLGIEYSHHVNTTFNYFSGHLVG